VIQVGPLKDRASSMGCRWCANLESEACPCTATTQTFMLVGTGPWPSSKGSKSASKVGETYPYKFRGEPHAETEKKFITLADVKQP
jgi:hypothetical protein